MGSASMTKPAYRTWKKELYCRVVACLNDCDNFDSEVNFVLSQWLLKLSKEDNWVKDKKKYSANISKNNNFL